MTLDQAVLASDPLSTLRRRQRVERRSLDPIEILHFPRRTLSLTRRLDDGVLIKVAPNAYVAAPPHEWPPWRRERYVRAGAITAIGERLPPGLAIGGRDAAILHGVPVLHALGPIEVHGATFPATLKQRVGARRVVRSGIGDHIVELRGIPVVSAARTALECLRYCPVDEAVVVADGFLNLMADPLPWERAAGDRALASALARIAAILRAEPARPGNTRTLRLLHVADGWAESPLESLARRAALLLGMPRPCAQIAVHTSRKTYYGDLGWRIETPQGARWLVLEVDGRAKVQEVRDVWKMQEREQQLRIAGASVLRVTARDLRDPMLRSFTEMVVAAAPEFFPSGIRPVRALMMAEERRLGLDGYLRRHPVGQELSPLTA